MRRTLTTALVAVLGLTLRVSLTLAATPAGTVVAMAGSCTANGHLLKRGDPVQISDTIDVPTSGNLKLQMADRSVITVAPVSKLAVAGYSVSPANRYAKLSLMQGLMRVLVTPFRGLSTFEVSTKAGTASVRSNSADWFMKAQTASAQVGVLVGTVDLTSPATGRVVSVPAHWGTRVETGRDPVLPRVWAQMEFNAVIHLTECCQAAGTKMETAYPLTYKGGN